MKILLTGATGYIGTEVLNHCIKSIYITHIYAVTRRPLDKTHQSSSKVTQLLRPDTTTDPASSSSFAWSASELSMLKAQGVTGCIWCLGTSPSSYSAQVSQQTDLEYPLAALQSFLSENLISDPGAGKVFRFVYLSTSGAERDATRWLVGTPAQNGFRRVKGAAERALMELADSEAAQGMVEVYCLRLGRVLSGGQSVGNVLVEAMSTSVSLQRVAKTAVDVVLDGWGEEGLGKGQGSRVLENADVLGSDWAEINTIS